MKSKKIIAVVGGSFLLAAAFLLILCIKFVNMKESSPTGKYAGKTEKVEQTTTDKKEQKKPDCVEVKISGIFIGYIGLHHTNFETDFCPCIEIGWRLCENSWGRGYATEGARACLEYAYRQLQLSEIYSYTSLFH